MKTKIFSIKAIVALGITCLLLPLSSCEDQLEVTPYSYFTSSNFFSNVNEADMATLGVYEIMSSLETYGWYVPQVFDLDTDIGQVSGLSNDDWRTIPHYLALSQTPFFYTLWSKYYAGIDRANVVIEKIPQMDLYTNGTQSEKDQLKVYLGEAKFLRGFYASELVRLWGDVPFKTKSSQAGDNLRGGLINRQEIYTQIVKDMKEASELLPTNLSLNERVNKWTAKSMLARIALFAGGYSLQPNNQMERPSNYKEYYILAQQQINDVMAANVYKLNNNYAQVFKNQCKHTLEPTENIFEVAFFNPSGFKENGSWVGHWNAPTTANGVYASTGTRYLTVRPFYESFQNNDQRKDFAVARYTINASGARVYGYVTSVRQDEQWAVGKWSREYQTGKTEERQYTHINYVVMRYSDLLLLRAEVENELNGGPNAIALDAINQVRRRAYGLDNTGSGIALTITNAGTGYTANPTITITGGGGDYANAVITARNTNNSLRTIVINNVGQGYTSVPTVSVTGGGGTNAVITASLIPKPTTNQIYVPTGLSQNVFLDLIIDERAKELCFEGMRRSDLIRWNKLGAKIAETSTKVLAIRSNYFYPSATNFIPNQHELYPFPQNETDVNKSITRQNPGY